MSEISNDPKKSDETPIEPALLNSTVEVTDVNLSQSDIEIDLSKRSVTWSDGRENEMPIKRPLESPIIKQAPVKKKFRVSWLTHQLSDRDSILRRTIFVVLLIAYAFAGSGIFYAIEKLDANATLVVTYWDALSYVNSIYTTIGYGTIVPKTLGGRLFTILYTPLGVFLFLAANSDLGFILVFLTGLGWLHLMRLQNRIRRFFGATFNKRRASIAVLGSEAYKRRMGNEHNLPLSAAILCFVFWVFLGSFYFYKMQDDPNEHQGWTYFQSYYFFFISVATIGLGDFNVGNTKRTIVDYVFIILGVALFSFVLRLISLKLEHIDEKMLEDLMFEYKQMLKERYTLESSNEDVALESEAAQRRRIRKLVQRRPGLVKYMIGRQVEEKLLNEYRKRSKLRLRSTQTFTTVRNVALVVRPNVADVQTTAGDSYVNFDPQKSKIDHTLRVWRNGGNAFRRGTSMFVSRRPGRGRGFLSRGQRSQNRAEQKSVQE